MLLCRLAGVVSCAALSCLKSLRLLWLVHIHLRDMQIVLLKAISTPDCIEAETRFAFSGVSVCVLMVVLLVAVTG